MTGSVAITDSAKLIEPSATGKLSQAVPEQGDEGESFNKVLSEQTAKALEATDDGTGSTGKPAKQSKKKSDPTTGTTEPTKGAPTQTTKLAVTTGLGPSNVHEDLETISPSASSNKESTKSTTPSTTSLLTTMGVDEVGTKVSSSVQGAGVVGEADDEATHGELTSPVNDDATEITTTSTLGSLATRSIVNDDPKSLSVEGDDKATPSSSSAASEDSTTSLFSSGATLAATTTEPLSDAESAALRATFMTTGGTSSPTASAHNPATASPSTASNSSTTHRSDGAIVTNTSTSAGASPTPSWASAVRGASSNAPSASVANDASSLDVTDLATSISQAAFGADGTYTLNVAMHPGELGHVQAVVSLNGDDLHVAITPQTSTGHEALSNAVDGLKSELSRGGLNVNVSLRDPESQSGRSHDEPQPTPSFNEDALEEGGSITPDASLTVSQIHLIL